MSNPEVRLIGALDDIRGRTTAVYQDHGGVRLDDALVEIMYDVAGARRLIDLLTDAIDGAEAWNLARLEAASVICPVCEDVIAPDEGRAYIGDGAQVNTLTVHVDCAEAGDDQ